MPPDKKTGNCEDTVVKNLGTLAACLRRCHIKQADMGATAKLFDEEACETGSGKPLSCRGKYDMASQALIAKAICPACLDATAQSNLANSLTSMLESEEGNVYCAGSSAFGDDDPGFVPPDKDSGKCENAVTKNVSTFAGCVGNCEVKRADNEFKGKTFDKDACENVGKSACRTKYDAKSAKLEPKPGKQAMCPLCLDMSARGNVADAAQNFLEQSLGQINCTSTFLVRDINPGPASSTSSQFTPVNGTLFFDADDGQHGYELWKSDGSAAGTTLVKDINPGCPGSDSTGLVNLNGTLLFFAHDGVHGPQELWSSDGTAMGTVLIDDICPGCNANIGTPRPYAILNGELLFAADDGTHGRELWKTDGTAAGTVLVKDINPGSGPSLLNDGSIVSNGIMYFRAFSFEFGGNEELWRTDGTEPGTLRVIRANSTTGPTYPRSFAILNGTVFFVALSHDGFQEGVWRSDGTSVGTTLVANVPGFVGGLENFGGTLYFFSGNEPQALDHVWQSDGTTAGTMLLDFNPSPTFPYEPFLGYLNGALFFRTSDASNGHALWKTDGTAAGTVLVKDIDPRKLIGINGVEYLTANGHEVWKTDGTPEGTVRVVDLNAASGFPQVVDGTLFSDADDGIHGSELFAFTP